MKPTSLTLLDRVRANDAEAWGRFVQVYSPIIYSWARHSGCQDNDALDLVQEVFQTVATRIRDFKREKDGDTLRGWLWGITRHKLLESYRRQRNSPQPIGSGDAWQRVGRGETLQEKDSIELSLDQVKTLLVQQARDLIRADFDQKTWQAFWRMAVDEQKAADVGKELEMSPNAVRQAKCRVLRRLRQELQDIL